MDYADLKIFACWGKDLDEQENLQNKSLLERFVPPFQAFHIKFLPNVIKLFIMFVLQNHIFSELSTKIVANHAVFLG